MLLIRSKESIYVLNQITPNTNTTKSPHISWVSSNDRWLCSFHNHIVSPHRQWTRNLPFYERRLLLSPVRKSNTTELSSWWCLSVKHARQWLPYGRMQKSLASICASDLFYFYVSGERPNLYASLIYPAPGMVFFLRHKRIHDFAIARRRYSSSPDIVYVVFET